MPQFILHFLSINFLDNWLKFPLEIIIAEYLFSYWLPRRRPFVLPSLVLLSVSSALLGQTQLFLFNIMQFLILFTLSVLLIYTSLKCSIWQALYTGVSAYIMQHIANTLTGLLIFYLPYFFIWQRFGYCSSTAIKIYQLIMYVVAYTLTYYLIYRFFIQKIKINGFYGLNNNSFTLFMSMALIFVIVLNYCRYYYVSTDSTTAVTNILLSCYSLIGCFFALLIISGYNQKSALAHSLDITKQLIRQQQKQYQISEENINLINMKCHDLKHQIHSLRATLSFPDSKQALDEIADATNIYDSILKTKSETVNIILTEKSLLCEQNQIQLTCMINEEPLSVLKTMDLYSILGNILDNAIEAVLKLSNPEQRIISLNIAQEHNMLLIHCENFYNTPVTIKNGLPVSDKGDSNYHGFGMKSLKYLVEKYNGNMSILTDDFIFYIDVLIPLS